MSLSRADGEVEMQAGGNGGVARAVPVPSLSNDLADVWLCWNGYGNGGAIRLPAVPMD